MKGKDLLSVSDLTREEIRRLLTSAVDLKAGGWLDTLKDKTLAIMFEKPSLRTRMSFELAMRQLGGETIYLSPAEVGLGKREAIKDVARVLARYVDIISCRTFAHSNLVELARYADIPIINALSDFEHPCQALADILTVYEKRGELEGVTLAFIGDGNNVANSLILAATATGMNFRIASPPGYEIPDKVMAAARKFASDSGSKIITTSDPVAAAKDADVLYTDVWTSMGQEEEAEKRRKVFAAYQINEKLLKHAKKDAIIMHPLPAHHGEEVAEGILDSRQSVVFEEAENRLHLQKALIAHIMGVL